MRVVSAIKNYYPTEKLLPTQEAIELWYNELKDLSFEVCALAVRRYAQTQKFPPTIADIREQAVIVSLPDTDWGEAWKNVTRAIGKHGLYGRTEAYAELDEDTLEVVKAIGWRSLCTSDNQMTDRANFRKLYEERRAKRRERAQIPQTMQDTIARLQEMMSIEESKKTETTENLIDSQGHRQIKE
jgi:hypothetical protein